MTNQKPCDRLMVSNEALRNRGAFFIGKFTIVWDFESRQRSEQDSAFFYFPKGAHVSKDPHYNGKRHEIWRDKVIRRAGGKCQICRRYGRLDKDGLPVAATTAHHIKHKEDYPELAYKVDNGMALCTKCHNQMHPEKGGKHY